MPRFLADQDQLDGYFILGGPDKERQKELIGGGIGYRMPTSDDTPTLYFRGTGGEVTPGGDLNRALEVEGDYLNLALGLNRTWEMSKTTSVNGWLGIATRHSKGQILGVGRAR